MADRSVIVRLKAEVGQYKAGMADAASATSKVGTASQVADAKAAKHAARMHALGRASQAAGAAILVGLGTAMVKSVATASSMHAA
ncbi:MAG: hypothetical protein KA973_19035, partial [Candidatus Microthrix sp.]|nr:hypothetical protein [Candidatus Microthrix sp.]